MANPTFQHHHYKEIAAVIAAARKDCDPSQGEDETINWLEDRFISKFKADNPKFSESRFRAASTNSPDMHGKDKGR